MTPKVFQILAFFACMPLAHAYITEAEANTPTAERKEISLDSNEVLCVNLGSDCFAAGYRYRRAAFPFDWVLTLDTERFLEILEDDFKHYLDPAYYTTHTNGAYLHTYYHFEFRHEHDQEFYAKYQRRVNRFRALADYQGKVAFLRRGYSGAEDSTLYWPSKEALIISSEWALRLNDIFKKKFPSLDYYVGILNYPSMRYPQPEEKDYYFQIVDRVVFFELDGGVHDLMEFMVDTIANCENYPRGVPIPVEIYPKPRIRVSDWTLAIGGR